MKTNDPTVRKRMKWIGMILLAVVAALGFSYLYTRGVSPIRFQLSLYTRCITRMGCGSHRMLPWLLPIHIQDCLYRNGSIDTVCYPQFLGILKAHLIGFYL